MKSLLRDYFLRLSMLRIFFFGMMGTVLFVTSHLLTSLLYRGKTKRHMESEETI